MLGRRRKWDRCRPSECIWFSKSTAGNGVRLRR